MTRLGVRKTGPSDAAAVRAGLAVSLFREGEMGLRLVGGASYNKEER
jgi:hypothetical protein